jgi:hypothetical protein
MPAGTLDAIRLETERLLLRPPVPEDAHAAAALLGDLEAMRFIGSGTVFPSEAVGEVVERWRLRWDDNGMGPFVVERRSDGPGRALRQLSGSQRPAERGPGLLLSGCSPRSTNHAQCVRAPFRRSSGKYGLARGSERRPAPTVESALSPVVVGSSPIIRFHEAPGMGFFYEAAFARSPGCSGFVSQFGKSTGADLRNGPFRGRSPRLGVPFSQTPAVMAARKSASALSRAYMWT